MVHKTCGLNTVYLEYLYIYIDQNDESHIIDLDMVMPVDACWWWAYVCPPRWADGQSAAMALRLMQMVISMGILRDPQNIPRDPQVEVSIVMEVPQ